MTARCINCNSYLHFGARGQRLKDMCCSCGGKYERMNWASKSFLSQNGFSIDLYPALDRAMINKHGDIFVFQKEPPLFLEFSINKLTNRKK